MILVLLLLLLLLLLLFFFFPCNRATCATEFSVFKSSWSWTEISSVIFARLIRSTVGERNVNLIWRTFAGSTQAGVNGQASKVLGTDIHVHHRLAGNLRRHLEYILLPKKLVGYTTESEQGVICSYRSVFKVRNSSYNISNEYGVCLSNYNSYGRHSKALANP